MYNLLFKFFLIFVVFILFSIQLFSQSKWVRATYRDDPSTTISLGWSGSIGILYYDTIDHGTNYTAYTMSQTVDRSTTHKGTNHYFVRLTNLQPGTIYYFVIESGGTTTMRYKFQTLSDEPDHPISFISGGDSRKDLSVLGIGDPSCWGNGCRQTRRDLNTIIARVRPDFIAFTGDYIRNYDVIFIVDSEDDWEEWFHDFNYTIAADGRVTPMIHSLGNHEDAIDLDRMFDVPNTDIYYATNFGGNLFRLYTLNSETDACTDVIQKNWFINDLQQHNTPSNTPYWKIVQYHQPMVPHAEYSARTDLIDCWSPHFLTYGVRLACESHTHVLKTTYPLKYDAAATSSYNGLVRDDSLGSVFIGDGAWGAPPRPTYAPITDVTQDVERTSGYFHVNVNKSRIQIKSVVPYPDSMVNVPTLTDDEQGTLLPDGVPLWRPANGSECIIIPNYNSMVAIQKIAEQREPSASIAPNPAHNYVSVLFKNALTEAVTIEIYNARGKKCQSHTNVRDQHFKVDVSELCSGVNFINIITEKDVESHKVIIVK
ncbi:MAG: T9SS type A sorting domain-containing protein [Saprospiraceae bacterium]|nr:T9SS type A sorting domain-containing protein [Saprospiraceae bacterium]